MTGTCEDPREVCNCDSNSEKMLEDGGFITDKDALPIKEVRYGDVDKSKGERGISTVGPLVCRWDYLMGKCCKMLLAVKGPTIAILSLQVLYKAIISSVSYPLISVFSCK